MVTASPSKLVSPVILVMPLRSFPGDWPGPGPIDLTVHDRPHASSTIEWWYVNSHLTLTDGRQCSLFASFFRMAVGRDESTQEYQYAHSLTWGLTDVNAQQYHTDSLVDQRAPEIGLDIIERGEDVTDPMLQRALREIFLKGQVPLPDRLLTKEATVSTDELALDYDGNQFSEQADGRYRLTLLNADGKVGADLYFQSQTSPVRHGDDGVVRGTAGEDMFYYFMPHCRVEGTIMVGGQSVEVAEATGWYDHEFGKPTSDAPIGKIDHDTAWNWISVQLGNGYRISAYDLFDNTQQGAGCGRWVILIDPQGNALHYDDFTLQPLQSWTSSRTFDSYPTAWQFDIPAAQVSLFVEADLPAQEFITIISKPAFWEGRVSIRGTIDHEAVAGLGYVERSGFGRIEKLDDFFRAVTKQTRKAVQALVPITPTDEQLRRLVASDDHAHYLDGLDPAQYSRALLKPIREMVDRGGKAWRSYAALACIDLLGGNSQPYMNWLAWPELLHTGSLIVDDVQDESDIRRGGLSCHKLYGQATAINAGNACYFLGELLLVGATFSDAKKLKLYSLYFETLRAAHAGQAIDIDGFDALMPEVVGYGRGGQLENRILAVHRLKSAVPASSLAQLGAVLADGLTGQVTALCQFMESLGLAFQIIDDVLNLRGFKDNLKNRGEDITAGKITLPVAKAMALLGWPARRDLWDIIRTKPTDRAVIDGVIDQLEACGAIDACQQQAEELVETAWRKLDALLPDSDVKIKMRAFGWYVLERHY